MLLDDELKGLINTGAVSGRLDQTLGRIVVLAVAMSIVETILICVQ